MPHPSTSILELLTESDWIDLQTTLDDQLANGALGAILEQLKAAGARSALVENDYLDRDYSEEFNAFYGRLFRRFRRHTRRLHFFKINLAEVAAEGTAALVGKMEAADQAGDYLGFAVIRPVRDAPLGRVVLSTIARLSGMDIRLQVRATYETHPLGARLSVRGVPFTQQDARISACAQASIWMSGRHFHTRHGGPWRSTVSITESASQPTDISLATALPAGSSGLNVNNMLRAIRAMDRHPYAFMADRRTIDGEIRLAWPGSLDPAAILARYVESAIPVIVGLRAWEGGQSEGHAVVVVGDTFQPKSDATLAVSRATIAEFSPYFLVHDDQRGPNLRMGVEPNLPHAETDYNVRDHVEFIIVPLPDKVFLPAETAERTAWDYLRFHHEDWPGLKAEHGVVIGAQTAALGDEVIAAYERNQVIARTYLTFGWKYKARMLANDIALSAKEQIAVHDLPRMVWVTELSRVVDINQVNPRDRRIFGHCVIDATSTGPFQPPLIFHATGFLTLFSQKSPDFFAGADAQVIPIPNEQLYSARVRR